MRTFTDATAKLLEPLNLFPGDTLELDISADLKHFYAQVYQSDTSRPDWRGWPSPDARFEFFKRVPEEKPLNKNHPKYNYTSNPHSELAATDITVQVIAALWEPHRIRFATDTAQTVYQYLVATCEAQELVAENYARFKRQGVLPDGIEDLEVCAALPLLTYQMVAAHNGTLMEGYAYFMEQGTGKTPTAIATACNGAAHNESGIPYRVLVICPKGVKTNWLKEFEQFSTRSAEITILRGTQMDRVNQLVENATAKDVEMRVVIASYETIRQSWEALAYLEWDLVICDESHMFKSHKTKRWQYLRELRPKSKKRIVMTGTEVANSIMDLWTQLEFLGEGCSGFTTFEAFKKFYGVYVETGLSRTLTGVQNLPFMHERLSRLSYRISLKEAMPHLPEKVYDIVDVEMSEEQAETYDNVATQLYLEAEQMLAAGDSNRTMTMNNVLTMLLRLAQITSGFVTWDEQRDIDTDDIITPKHIQWFSTNPKLDACCELLKDKTPQEKTIVWACWRPDLQVLEERFKELNINYVRFLDDESQRVDAQDRFNNDPRCKVFLGNPASGGVGLNLLGHPLGKAAEGTDTDADHEIFYSQNWSPIVRWQAEARAVRNGTRKRVRITDLCVANTIDEQIRTRVLKKKENAMLIGDIRQILTNIISGVGKHAD